MDALRSIIAAFSLFSRIPMPRMDWDEGSMRYLMGAFPLVGVAVGTLQGAWCLLCLSIGLTPFSFAVGLVAISMIVTGGIHLDGLCDVIDALSSQAPPERRREILKDPHIGAFAALGMNAYLLVMVALLSEARMTPLTATLLLVIPAWARACSGATVLLFPRNPGQGMLSMFKQSARKGPALAALALWHAICLAAAIWACPPCALAMVVALIACTLLLHHVALRRFGGMSGDLSGFYLQICEISLIACMVIVGRLL